MDLMRAVSLIKFGVREATAFIGHSFADGDWQIVNRITAFLGKLGIVCDSGHRAEARAVSEKVAERILAAEIFVGIFTRRDQKADGKYSTSAWVIEEKATAINSGKRLLLFVEDGVEEIGGLQGDYEYIRFKRNDLADALIRAMDYVLLVTSVPLQCQFDPATNQIRMQLGAPGTYLGSLESEIKQLRRQKEVNPNDPNVRLTLADRMQKNGQVQQAIAELRELVHMIPQLAQAHHNLVHMLQNAGNTEDALLSFQNALDANPSDYKNYRCYGKCLYQKAKKITEPTVQRSTLEKAKRLFERAALIGGEQQKQEVSADVFLVDESLRQISDTQRDMGEVAKGKGASRTPSGGAIEKRGRRRKASDSKK